jgi:hypothetical protein
MESEKMSGEVIGVVYKLLCEDGHYYIGSTKTELKCRLYAHKTAAKIHPDRKVYAYINGYGWDKTKILCVEQVKGNVKSELLEKENEYIRKSILDPLCLNINDAILKEEEKKQKHQAYIEANKDNINAYHAEYRLKNAEKRREYSRQYAKDHPEEVKAARKQRYEENKEEILAAQKVYVEANKERISEYKKEYAEKNKEKLKEAREKYAEENKELIQEKGKKYYEENKEVIRAKFKAYREANQDKLREYRRKRIEKMKGELEETHKCECGGQYSWAHEKRHKESKRHLKFM